MREIPPSTAARHEAGDSHLSTCRDAKLWTFQHAAQFDTLLREGVLRGNWESTYSNDEEAYRYMCRIMKESGLDCVTVPPIWAWHSCGSFQKAPDNQMATQLLSLAQLSENAMVLLSLECPGDHFLLSNYHQWCDLAYFPLRARECDVAMEKPRLEESERRRRIFEINFADIEEEDDLIQATLPIFGKEWLTQVHRVVLNGSDEVIFRIADISPFRATSTSHEEGML